MMSATCGRSTRRHVAEAPHLAFAGQQAYHGSAQHLRGWDERRRRSRKRSTEPITARGAVY